MPGLNKKQCVVASNGDSKKQKMKSASSSSISKDPQSVAAKVITYLITSFLKSINSLGYNNKLCAN